MSDVAIRVEHLSKVFRLPLDRPSTLKYRVTHWRSAGRSQRFQALDDLTFEVPHGQFLGIIGHNGSGKSTLLKILSRIYVPDGGVLEIDGHVSPFLELGVGFNPELTARENVYLNGAVLGLTRSEIDRRIAGILDFAEVQQFAEMKLKNFSSGMQVRLAFSVAIQADAGILLMDEVLAVGDARFAEKCFDVFARYKREGRTIVLVTHDLGSVNVYCDRALLLDHGRLVADGPPSEVTARYRRNVGDQSDAEAAPTDGATGGAIPIEANRWGSRELSITAVRIVDGAGVQHQTMRTDQPLTVEVDYEVHDDSVGDFIVGLAFERTDGLTIAGPNTALSGRVIPCPPRGTRGTVRYTIPRLPLLGASYFLTAALYDRHANHAFDHIERVLPFRVTDERGRPGLVELDGTWDYDNLSRPLGAEEAAASIRH